MTVQLFEGCFGVTRGKYGEPQEVVGPVTITGFSPWSFFANGNTYRANGMWSASDALTSHYDIIAVFPDRASAEAYLRGEAEWGPWRSDISEWNVTTHDVRFECIDGIHKISTRPRTHTSPVIADQAQAVEPSPNFNLGISVLAWSGGIRVFRGMVEIVTLTRDEAKQLRKALKKVAAQEKRHD